MTRINFKNLPDQTTPITAENLNKLNNLAIDTSVGEHEEEVVLVEPKNLIGNATFTDKIFLYAGGNIGYNSSGGEITYVLPIKESTKYTISRVSAGTRFRVATYTTDSITTTITPTANVVSDTSTSITIESGTNDKYLFINVESKIISSLQVEKGNTKTTYETPKPSSIYANGDKYTDTLNIGVEPNNSGLWVEHSKNLTQVETGGYSQSNGSKITDNTLYRSANYIKITKNKYILSQNGTTGKTIRVFFYDSNMSLISNSVTSGVINITNSNAKYFTWQGGATGFNNTMNGIQVETGETATDYEPYVEPSIKVNNNGVYETIYQVQKVVWANSSQTTEMGDKTITLDDEYSKVEIIFRRSTSSDSQIITTFYNDSKNTEAIGMIDNKLLLRQGNLSGKQLNFWGALIYNTYGTGTNNNSYMIPIKVIGYK